MADPEVRISYGVKELFEQINVRLGSIDGKLDGKADLMMVLDLAETVRKLERHVKERDAVEAEQIRMSAAAFTKREKFIGFLIAALAILIQPLQRILHF